MFSVRADRPYKTWAEFALELSNAVKLVLPAEAVADTEKYVALKRVEMLIGLSDAELWEIAAAGNWTRILPGKVLIRDIVINELMYNPISGDDDDQFIGTVGLLPLTESFTIFLAGRHFRRFHHPAVPVGRHDPGDVHAQDAG